MNSGESAACLPAFLATNHQGDAPCNELIKESETNEIKSCVGGWEKNKDHPPSNGSEEMK